MRQDGDNALRRRRELRFRRRSVLRHRNMSVRRHGARLGGRRLTRRSSLSTALAATICRPWRSGVLTKAEFHERIQDAASAVMSRRSRDVDVEPVDAESVMRIEHARCMAKIIHSASECCVGVLTQRRMAVRRSLRARLRTHIRGACAHTLVVLQREPFAEAAAVWSVNRDTVTRR